MKFSDVFAKGELLENERYVSDEILDYLGASLHSWVIRQLQSVGADKHPVIEGEVEQGAFIKGAVYIAKTARVEATAYIEGPSWIGPGCEVRHGAYVRGNVFASSKCVLGHASEFKGSLLLDGAKAGHFAYVGDSLLGRNVNLGAGTKIANLKLKADEVYYRDPKTGKKMPSGLKKFGAIIGDDAQTGCNAVVSPGSILMPQSLIMSAVHFHGTLDSGALYTGRGSR